MAQNFSLQNSMSQALQGTDPFSQAGPQGLQPQQSQDMQSQSQALPDAMQTGPQPDFQALLKNIGIDASGLSQDKQLGWMQLQNRMQSKLGANYQSSPQFKQLMQAWNNQPGSSTELTGMQSRAKRTLGALLGQG